RSLRRSGKYRDAVASKGTHPQFLSDLYRNRSAGELLVVRLIDQLRSLQRIRVNSHDIRRLLTLTGSIDGPIGSKADVIHAESQGDNITFYRRLPAGQAKERLTAPCRDVKPLAILRYFDSVGACGVAARHLCPAFTSVPFPQFAVVFSRHHF